MEAAKDMLFPSRVLRKELENAHRKVALLENELEEVRQAKKRITKVRTS